ncbi:NUDIX hydrolase domain-like protein [Dactylonectria macrodidyma]|uniref:NUDIX hydrolase domain-like protein n=1 Tax=Dactylonectria macrodidyma TaxID=307937 RepID=A0A9P9EW03_9HYPO|nr:NUDIX hydrolase domain-like protein [Dactylonectria macrodidyma]
MRATLLALYSFSSRFLWPETSNHRQKMVANQQQSFLPVIAKIDSFRPADCLDRFPYYQRDPAAYKKFMKDYYYFAIQGYEAPRTVTLTAAGTFEERSRLTSEQCAVRTADGEHVLHMSIMGSGMLGTVVPGVQLIAWTETENHRRYWLQRRSARKNVHPGKLDVTAGGNFAAGERPIDGIVREAFEEASIPEDYTRNNIRSCGTISYHLATNGDGSPGSQPHVQYAYEMELPNGMIPKPSDGEVEEFITMDEQEIRAALFQDDFKPIVGVLWLGHFYGHGMMTAENEKNFEEICSRLHRKHDLFKL